MTEKTKSDWLKLKPEDVEELVIDLAKKNTPPEKIGLILRDQHGIPKAKIFGKKISQILKENSIHKHSDYDHIAKKIDALKKHFEKHKHDYSSQRTIVQATQKLNKIKKYISS